MISGPGNSLRRSRSPRSRYPPGLPGDSQSVTIPGECVCLPPGRRRPSSVAPCLARRRTSVLRFGLPGRAPRTAAGRGLAARSTRRNNAPAASEHSAIGRSLTLRPRLSRSRRISRADANRRARGAAPPALAGPRRPASRRLEPPGTTPVHPPRSVSAGDAGAARSVLGTTRSRSQPTGATPRSAARTSTPRVPGLSAG